MDNVIIGELGFLIGGPKSHAMTSSNLVELRNFLRDKDIIKWKIRIQKPWPVLARNQDFAERGGLEVNVKKRKCVNWETWCAN